MFIEICTKIDQNLKVQNLPLRFCVFVSQLRLILSPIAAIWVQFNCRNLFRSKVDFPSWQLGPAVFRSRTGPDPWVNPSGRYFPSSSLLSNTRLIFCALSHAKFEAKTGYLFCFQLFLNPHFPSFCRWILYPATKNFQQSKFTARPSSIVCFYFQVEIICQVRSDPTLAWIFS